MTNEFAYPDFGGKKVIVAEDAMINFKLLKIILEKSNLEVLWAQNGQECVDLFTQNPTVSLILMDMQMPVMDGMEAASIILKNDPKVPIIFQTAFEFDDERRKVMSLGCAEFINKPIDRILLYQKISQVIR